MRYGVDAQQSRWSIFTMQMAYFVFLEARTRGPALFQPACAAKICRPCLFICVGPGACVKPSSDFWFQVWGFLRSRSVRLGSHGALRAT